MKQIMYKAENKAFPGKGDINLFQKNLKIIIKNIFLVNFNVYTSEVFTIILTKNEHHYGMPY
jgi:hypothetical protein